MSSSRVRDYATLLRIRARNARVDLATCDLSDTEIGTNINNTRKRLLVDPGSDGLRRWLVALLAEQSTRQRWRNK